LKGMSLNVISQSAELAQRVAQYRNNRLRVGFVPTMGALHAGHGALIEQARRENEAVVVSIFVNPLQFDRKADLELYPRDLNKDLAFCEALGTDTVYAPSPEELYPREQLAFAEVPALEPYLCGRYRPGHFRGVATVVLKLFNIVRPDRAYFGEKDAQQLAIIRRMVQDLNVPVRIVPVATVREFDGLAMSSRNVRLTPSQRQIAPILYKALTTAAELLAAGESSVNAVRGKSIAPLLAQPGLKLEYFEVCEPETLEPLDQVGDSALIAGAMFLGDVRLIDNITWHRKWKRGRNRTRLLARCNG
jgi:pantoate--beta-alanine ligase